MSIPVYKHLRRLRIWVSLLVMAGVTAGVALSYHTFLESWQLVPAILTGGAEWVLMWAFVTAICGRLYCSTACPLGTLQDMLARLRRRPNGYFYAPAMSRLRSLFLLAFIVAAILGLGFLVSALDPAARYESLTATSVKLLRTGALTLASALGAVATLGVVAAFAIARGRLLCNTLCPLGTVLGTFSRLSLYRIDIDTDRCVGCGLCTARCKSQCIDPSAHTVDFSRCVMCFDCVADCPTGAITLRKGRHQLQTPLLISDA